MANESHNGRTKWFAIMLPLAVAVFSVIGFIYAVGQRGGKITEVVEWKKEMAPRIERMDLEGSVATKNFIHNYEKEQATQYERLKELEREVRQLDVMKQKIEALERAQLDRNPRYQPPEPRR